MDLSAYDAHLEVRPQDPGMSSSPWALAWQLTAETCFLARDASAFAFASLLPRALSETLSNVGGALLFVLGKVESQGSLVTSKALSSASAIALERTDLAKLLVAADTRRDEFVAAFPRYAPWLPDQDPVAVFTCGAWVLAVVFVVLWGVRSLWPKRGPEVLFFPNNDGQHLIKICEEIGRARRRVWVAMFVLTEDVLTKELLCAYKRGLDVRIIVEQKQLSMPGADAYRLAAAGIPVVTDGSSWALMHHKFAVLDGTVLTGSFNWTHQAICANRENLCILRDGHVTRTFATEFLNLWEEFRSGQLEVKEEGKVEEPRTRRQRAASPVPRKKL